MGKDQGQGGTAPFWVGAGTGEGSDDSTGQDGEQLLLTQGLFHPLPNP